MTDRSASQLAVSVLGPLRVTAGERELEPGGPKPRLVLALLVAHAGTAVGIDRLIDDLWGDDPPPTARKTLQVHVSNLRRNLGKDAPIVTERSGYRLDPTGVTIDVVEFERDCERACSLPPGAASSLLSSALGRWRGLAYADLRHEDAIRAEATRLDELRVAAIEQRIDESATTVPSRCSHRPSRPPRPPTTPAASASSNKPSTTPSPSGELDARRAGRASCPGQPRPDRRPGPFGTLAPWLSC